MRHDRVIRDMKAMRITSVEPTIDEMLADPIVRLLMDHDGVGEEDLRRLIKSVGRRLMESAEPAPARCSAALLPISTSIDPWSWRAA